MIEILNYLFVKEIDLSSVNLLFTHLERIMSAWAAHRLKRYQLPNNVFEQSDTLPETPTKLPRIKMNFSMKLPKNLNIISKVGYSSF